MAIDRDRPAQNACLVKIRRARNQGSKKALVVMASGLGKTVIAAIDVRRYLRQNPDARILYLCHQNDILRQAREIFEEVLPGWCTFGYFHGSEKNVHQVTCLFASFQTMARSRQQFGRREFDYIVVDESHHEPAVTFRPTVRYFQPTFVLGLTATPDRMDLQDIRKVFGPEIFNLPLEEALGRGLLTPVDYRIVTDDWNLQRILVTPLGKLSMNQLNRTVFAQKRDRAIVRILEDKLFDVSEPRMVIFCRSIQHCERFSKLIKGSAPIHTKLPLRDQQERLQAFREGEVNTILTVDKLNEGIDIPDANVIVFMRSTASKTVFFQQLGRGLRLAPNKKHVLVLDFVANADRLVMLNELFQMIPKLGKSIRPAPNPINIDTGTRFEFNEVARNVLEVIATIKAGYTKERVVGQVQNLAQRLGHSPTYRELQDACKRGEIVHPSTINYLFGSLRNLLQEAELTVNTWTNLTRSEAIMQLQILGDTLGHYPSQNDIQDSAKRGEMAHSDTIARLFGGSLQSALIAAGFKIRRRRGMTKQEVIHQYQRLSAKIGKTPTQSDINAASKRGEIVSNPTISGLFGGINNLHHEAGHKVHRRTWTKTEILDSLIKFRKRLKRDPVYADINEACRLGKTPSAGTINKNFGNLAQATRAAKRRASRL